MYFVNKVRTWGGMQEHPRLSLITHFRDLPDPRVKRTREHQLIDILVISVCTLLCGGEGFNDMEDFGEAKQDWFKTFLKLRRGLAVSFYPPPPTQSTAATTSNRLPPVRNVTSACFGLFAIVEP